MWTTAIIFIAGTLASLLSFYVGVVEVEISNRAFLVGFIIFFITYTVTVWRVARMF